MGKLVKTYHNTCSPDSLAFQRMARDLAAYVESLKKELQMANEALEASLSLSAPISKLPNEILLQVFQHLGSVEHEMPCSSTLLQLRPAALACRRWYHIIISNPKFWTRVTLPSRTLSSPQGAQMRLGRAGALPLTLKLSTLCSLTERSLDQLGSSLDRVTSVEVELDEEEVAGGNVFTSCHGLPNALALSLQMYFNTMNEHDPLAHMGFDFDGHSLDPDPPESPAVSIILTSRQYPRLASVDLHIEYPIQRLALPWSQLKTLNLHTLDVIDFNPSHIIAQLGHVERLGINIGLGIPQSSSIDDFSSITLPFLRYLSLSVNVPDDGTLNFLSHSKFPSLQELEINGICSQRQLVESLRNSKLWTITLLNLSFMIVRAYDEAAELIHTLSEFKQLESFQFNVTNAPYLHGSFIRTIVADSDGILFPRLHSLEVSHVAWNEADWNLIQNLLRTRVSCIDVPIDERKPLREVVMARLGNRPEHGPSTTQTQMFRPLCYNDGVTYVQVEGVILDGF